MRLSASAFRAKSFRSPVEAELLLFCLSTCTQDACANSEASPKGEGQDARSKREVTKRKRVDIPVDSRCAACRPRLTAAQGPRVEQRAIGQLLLRCLNSGIHALAMARTRCATAARLQEPAVLTDISFRVTICFRQVVAVRVIGFLQTLAAACL